MTRLLSTRCCALGEIDYLSHSNTPEEAFCAIRSNLIFGKPAMVIFTGVVERRVADHASGRKDNYGKAFADYLTKNRLGTVYRGIRPVRNYHTGNKVKVWVWIPNHSAVRRIKV